MLKRSLLDPRTILPHQFAFRHRSIHEARHCMTKHVPLKAPRQNHPLFGRTDRPAVELCAYVVRAGDQIVDVRVMDLTCDGCRVETVEPLTVGEEVKLSVLGRGAVSATVRWYKGRKAGLLFKIDPDRSDDCSRATQRTPIGADVSLRRQGRVGYRVRVIDASSAGCKCEFVERPSIGERLWIKFDGLEALEAKVCWVEGFSCGLLFVTQIHAAVFEMLLQRVDAL